MYYVNTNLSMLISVVVVIALDVTLKHFLSGQYVQVFSTGHFFGFFEAQLVGQVLQLLHFSYQFLG